MGESVRSSILANVGDLIANFLYYDRKEDEDLPRGEIEKAIEEGVLTVDEIVDEFKMQLEKGI